MWKKARRSVDSFPVDLYNGGKTLCPLVRDSDIVKRRVVRRWKEMPEPMITMASSDRSTHLPSGRMKPILRARGAVEILLLNVLYLGYHDRTRVTHQIRCRSDAQNQSAHWEPAYFSNSGADFSLWAEFRDSLWERELACCRRRRPLLPGRL